MIRSFAYGMLNSNICIVSDGGEAMVVDAGGLSEVMLRYIEANNLKVKYIVLTHGHYDHICALEKYLERFPEAILMYHKEEHRVLTDPEANLSPWLGREEKVFDFEHQFVKEGDVIKVGSLEFKVLHTPGHTPGGICLLCESEKILISGDTVFDNGYGRTDFKYGNETELYRSLERLYPLCRENDLYAGHDTGF